MHKSKVLRIASLLCFGVSAAFSVMNLWSAAFGILEKILNAFFGVLMEYGKVTLFYKSMSSKTANIIARRLCGLVYVILLSFSIFFSMCFIMNNENQNKNVDQMQNKQVLAQKKIIEDDDKTLTRLNREIEGIRTEYQASIDIKKQVLSSTALDMPVTRKNITDGISSLTNEMTSKIAAKQTEISTAETKKSDHVADLGNMIEAPASSKGFTAMIALIAKAISWSTWKVTFVFYMILSIAFELTSSLLWYFSEHERENQVIVINESKRPIGFKPAPLPLPAGITCEMVQSYVDHAWTVPGDLLPGYERTANVIGIKPSAAQKIHKYLCDSGHSFIVGRSKTYKSSDRDSIHEYLNS